MIRIKVTRIAIIILTFYKLRPHQSLIVSVLPREQIQSKGTNIDTIECVAADPFSKDVALFTILQLLVLTLE